jgi:nucleotide-binding universal stress UspA family protein
MVRTVVAGPDGSPESRAAAEWAAREARLRGRPLKIVHVWEPAPEPALRVPRTGGGAHAHRTARSGTGAPADGTRRHIPRETAADLRLRHPDVDVTTEQLTGRPAEILLRAAERAELLVLGSRGLSGIGGFLVGSVGQSVVAHTEVPVVLVRAGEPSADALPPDRAGTPVPGARPGLLGLDTGDRADAVTAFAFAEAARRGTGLRVVHAWNCRRTTFMASAPIPARPPGPPGSRPPRSPRPWHAGARSTPWSRWSRSAAPAAPPRT